MLEYLTAFNLTSYEYLLIKNTPPNIRFSNIWGVVHWVSVHFSRFLLARIHSVPLVFKVLILIGLKI